MALMDLILFLKIRNIFFGQEDICFAPPYDYVDYEKTVILNIREKLNQMESNGFVFEAKIDELKKPLFNQNLERNIMETTQTSQSLYQAPVELSGCSPL